MENDTVLIQVQTSRAFTWVPAEGEHLNTLLTVPDKVKLKEEVLTPTI